MSSSAASPSLAERISAVILRVMACVAGRVRPAPEVVAPVEEMTPAETLDLVHPWLARQRRRILGLMERIATGRLPEPRAPAPRARAPRPSADGAGPQPRTPPLRRPRGFGWLSGLVAEAEAFGAELARLVAEPEMRSMCLATPRMGGLVRPVLHALGQERPVWMAPTPRPRSRPTYPLPWPERRDPDPPPPAPPVPPTPVPAHVALHAAAVAGWDGRSPAPGGPYRTPFEPPDSVVVISSPSRPPSPPPADRGWPTIPILRRRW